MKVRILLPLIIFISILGCSKDSENEDAEPLVFQVEVNNLTDRSATVSWTIPEGENISYKVYLNNELIEENYTSAAYTFSGLSAETNYSGKITATDGSKSTSVDFSFTTEEYVPHVYEGNVILYSQEQVDEFGSNHYNIIEGFLIISSSINQFILDLSPLNALIEVQQGLKIEGISTENLEGLDNLSTVGGELIIYHNYNLIDLQGLQNLTHIGGDIEIYSNSVLEDISALENITGFSKGVGIGGNAITNINMMQDAVTLHHLSLIDNQQLQTVTGFQNVVQIEDYVDIFQNISLTSLSGLSSVTSIGGLFNLESNTQLAQIDLVNLTSVGNVLFLWENQVLTNLDGFSNLATVGGLYVINHYALSDLCGITTAVINYNGSININGNLYNPTIEDFINGDCSL